jgi:hypothetical protein
MAKMAFNKKKTLFTSKVYLNLKKKLVKWHIRSMHFYGAEIWELQKLDKVQLQSFEVWCWRWI